MSLLQDIKESFESRSYLDEESMEGQNFIVIGEDDYTNQIDVERSEYTDRKVEEEYAKEQEAVRSTIELLEDNLEDIKSLSPAYTESAKEVVNAQLADVSQALSLENGFGQLELDDTGHVSMESYLEVRKALAKASKVYSVLSMEGIMDWFRGKGKTKNPLEILKDNIEAGKERTEPIPGTELKYLAAKNLNPATALSELEKFISYVAKIHNAYKSAAPVGASITEEEIKASLQERDSNTSPFRGKLKAINTSIANVINSSNSFLDNIELTLEPEEFTISSYDFDYYSTAGANVSVKPMTLTQARNVLEKVDSLSTQAAKISEVMKSISKIFPYDLGEGIEESALRKYTTDSDKLGSMGAVIWDSSEWSNKLHRNYWDVAGHIDLMIKDLITYAILSTQ